MPRLESIWWRVIESREDPGKRSQAYDECLRSVLSSPLWSPACPDGVRIPWRMAAEAKAHASLAAAFGSPGLYLFASGNGIPRYWGKATLGKATLGKGNERNLWDRLAERYVCGRWSQCQLAADHESALRSRGIEGFPEEVRAGHLRRRGNNSLVRLKGAVDFACHEIEGIWFTLVPMSGFEAEEIGKLEDQLICQGHDWNRAHGYPLLVNRPCRKDK